MATYRVPVLSDFSWQPPVDDRIIAPTESETKGTRYIIIATASGVFAGKENQIATAKQDNPTLAEHWYFDTPTEGWTCRVKDENVNYEFDGADWAISGIAAANASIDSLESVDSTLIASVDSLELIDSALIASVDSLESVDSTLIASVDSLELIDSALIASVDSLESADSTLTATKQDKGTYVAEYGAIEFTI